MSAPRPGLDPELVTRFTADVAGLLGSPLRDTAPLALAVSGGPDSMAMLALSAAAFPGLVCAATVDHGLRPAAATEAAMVARWCAKAGVAHQTLGLRDRIGATAIQATARALRYEALGGWAIAVGAVALATAHHLDDQAETLLMRAVRGSGPAGLAGVRPQRRHRLNDAQGQRDLLVIRPLLGWRRAWLRTLVTDAAIPFVDDPSNEDRRFERVRVRHLLTATPWLDPVGLARSARFAGEAEAALAAIAEWFWTDRILCCDGAEVALRVADVPREVQRLIVRKAILSVRTSQRITRPTFDPASNIEPLLESLRSGIAATQAGVMAVPDGMIWHFRPEPPRRSA